MIRTKQLNNSVGNFALRDISFEVADAEYFVLLGPSGSGKTLLLESLCGLRRIDSGRIIIDEIDLTRAEPRRRNIGYLPQDHAIFPHLPVRYNVGFGLTNPLAIMCGAQHRWIDQLMEMMDIAHLAHRFPRGLSGGEKQRVALARALAIQPRLLILDEPVSALDEHTRDDLCQELKRVQRQTGTTTIHVCHNFAEMLAVADRVGVINEGRLVQVGLPQEILRKPLDSFVAEFVRARNVFAGTGESSGPGSRLTCPDGTAFSTPYSLPNGSSTSVEFIIRPEDIYLGASRVADMPPGTTYLEGKVVDLNDLGATVEVAVAVPGDMALAVSLGRKEMARTPFVPGDSVHLAVPPDAIHVLDPKPRA